MECVLSFKLPHNPSFPRWNYGWNCSATDEYLPQDDGSLLAISGIRRILFYSLFAKNGAGSWQQYINYITEQGGQVNTRISQDALVISIIIPRIQEKLALSALSSFVMSPQLSDRIINSAMEQVRYELNYLPLDRLAAADVNINSLIFPADNPYSTTTYGSNASIKLCTPEIVRTFAHAMLVPERAILSLATATEIDKSRIALLQAFQQWKRGVIKWPRYPTLPVHLDANDEKLLSTAEQGLLMTMSFPVCGISNEDYRALQLLAIIIAGGTGSRFYQHIRQDHQLAYHVGKRLSENIFGNVLSFYAISSEDQQQELRQAFIDEWNNLLLNPPDKEEIARALGYMRGLILYESQSSSKISANNALVLLAALPTEEVDYANVSEKDLQRVIKQYCSQYLLTTIIHEQ